MANIPDDNGPYLGSASAVSLAPAQLVASGSRSEYLIPFSSLLEGWNHRLDSPKSPGLQYMRNTIISDRGGVAIRPGTELFGAADTTNTAVTSIHTAKKRDGTNVMLRTSGTVLEFYNTHTSAWTTLKTGFTSGQTFGFADHNINTDTVDYVYFCNAVEPYQRWNLAYDKTTSTLVGGETSIPIQSTLQSDVYFSGTASSVTTTTITMPAGTWATDIWNGFYVRITSGAAQGQISPISATTATQITFTAIGTLAGTPTFQIRRLKFGSATPTIVYSTGTTMAVTGITTDTGLTVASAPALASGSSIAEVPTEYPAAPRGNILKVLFQQVYMSGVKKSPSSVYRSKLNDATSFTVSSPRAAGDGDVVDFPEGGGAINDLNIFEDKLIVFKESAIYQMTYTQDANDIVQKVPIVQSPLIGTKGRTARLGDDIVFISAAGELTTLSRVTLRDARPARTNIAWPIKRAIRNFSWTTARAYTFTNYTVIAGKVESASASNDKALVFDNNLERWIGEWDMPITDFTEYNNALYFGSSASKEVYKMFTTDTAQTKGSTLIGYDTYVETNWTNRTSDQISNQTFDTIAITGYVKPNTTITFYLWYDYESEPSITWTLDPTDSDFLSNNILGTTGESVFGTLPLGYASLGVDLGSPDGDHDEQRFLVYYRLPLKNHVWVKLGWSTSGTNQYYELTDIRGNFVEADAQMHQTRTQSIET